MSSSAARSRLDWIGRTLQCAAGGQLPAAGRGDARLVGSKSPHWNCGPPGCIAYSPFEGTYREVRMARLKIVAAVWLLGTAAALAQDKVRFQTDWIPSGEHAMYYGGWQKGIFASEGIDVTITRGYGSGDTVTKLAAGAFDFGVADMAAVMTARARQNVPVKTIAVVYSQSPHSLFVLRSSGITNFKGLEGKRIGITPGNSHKFYFPKVAERAGTDPSKITWVSMDGAAMAAQLIAKNLDAAPFYSIHHYYQNKAAKVAGEEIVVLPFV